MAQRRTELTKSLELFAPTAPTPMLESMLSSYRIGLGGGIEDGISQCPAVWEDGRDDESRPDPKRKGCAGRTWESVACMWILSPILVDDRTAHSIRLVVFSIRYNVKSTRSSEERDRLSDCFLSFVGSIQVFVRFSG